MPVEVVRFGWRMQLRYLESLGARAVLRRGPDGAILRTDQGNVLLDADFGIIADPRGLAAALKARTGIVEHGLFLGLANDVVVAGERGLRHLRRPGGGPA